MNQRFDEIGLSGFEGRPSPPAGHVHDAVEICVFDHAAVTMLYAGAPRKIPPNRLVVHWGMLPHQVKECPEGATVVGLHLPMAWLLQWRVPPELLTRLLGLDLIVEPRRYAPCTDLELLRNWNRLLKGGHTLNREIVLSEARARLLRLYLTQPETSYEMLANAEASQVFQKALRHIVHHFREPVHLAEIAKASGVSTRQLTRIFHHNTGQTINAYITLLRLSHAMQLLASSDRTVTDVMFDAGFSCSTHFYKVFRQRTGTTPARYRRGRNR